MGNSIGCLISRRWSVFYDPFSFQTISLFWSCHKFSVRKIQFERRSGSIPHSQALSTALSGTLGLGNIAGVAIAISVGGPGSIFWMWVTAIVGVSTKFYTASLSVMYRHQDLNGQIYGGPMYVIMNGMGKSGTRWQHCLPVHV